MGIVARTARVWKIYFGETAEEGTVSMISCNIEILALARCI